MSRTLTYEMIKALKKIGHLNDFKDIDEDIKKTYAMNDRYGTFSADFCKLIDAKVFKFNEVTPAEWQHETTIKQNKIYKLTDDAIVRGFTRTHNGYLPIYDVKDCVKLPPKSKEEIEKNEQSVAKRNRTMTINRTCEFCSRVERKKIKNHWEGKRVCYDCLDKFEEEKAFQESKIHNFRIKGISYEESRIELALEIQSEVEKNRKIELSLEREPANLYDQNAIKIMHSGEQLGYVDARVASKIAPILDNSSHKISIEFDYDDFEIYNYDHYYVWDDDDSIEVRTVYRLNAILKIK